MINILDVQDQLNSFNKRITKLEAKLNKKRKSNTNTKEVHDYWLKNYKQCRDKQGVKETQKEFEDQVDWQTERSKIKTMLGIKKYSNIDLVYDMIDYYFTENYYNKNLHHFINIKEEIYEECEKNYAESKS